MKKWLESKTIRFFGAVLIVCLALGAELVTGEDLGTGIDVDPEATISGILIAVVGIALRFATRDPIN